MLYNLATSLHKGLIRALSDSVGDVLLGDGNWGQPTVLSSATATTSGTSHDISIAANVRSFTLMLRGVSTNGTSNLLFQLGDAGGIENTSYIGNGTFIGATTGITNYTTGFGIPSANAGVTMDGAITFTLQNSGSFRWVAVGNFTRDANDFSFQVVGRKTLSAALTTVRLTTVNGTDTFDAGEISVLSEI